MRVSERERVTEKEKEAERERKREREIDLMNILKPIKTIVISNR